MKNAGTEAGTKKMNCFRHYCFCVCMFVDFLFYGDFNTIPAKGFILVYSQAFIKYFQCKISFLKFSAAWFLLITLVYDVYQLAASDSISVTDFLNIIK